MELRIDRTPGETAGRGMALPVYQQIVGQIRGLVEQGHLGPGDRLPPIRELARTLGVNRDTVSSAYEVLAAQGMVDARVGRGTFVRGLRPRPGRAAEPVEIRWAAEAERLLDFERSRVAYGAVEDAIPLHALKPDPSLFPVEAFRRALGRSFGERGAGLLDYGDPQGDAALREAIAQRLCAAGTRVAGDQMVLCQGASQGLFLALRLFAGAGQTVAIEEPTYHNALAACTALGLRALPIPMRADGPDLDVLDRVLARAEVKLFYTMPTFHNPMGTTTSRAHREELLALAASHGKPVIEDAYEMDLRLSGRPVPSLLGLDEEGLVVQLLSFSKSLFPGLRCGAVVARGRHVEGLLALRHAADLGVLVGRAGGEEFTCANPFIMERAVGPILGALEDSDDLHRDVLNIAHAFEALAGATYQALVASLEDPSMRSTAMLIGGEEQRHAAALAAAINPDALISPVLFGEPVEADDEGFPVPYAIPSTFGQLTGIELVVGARNDEGARFSTQLQTPADNTFVYDYLSC